MTSWKASAFKVLTFDWAGQEECHANGEGWSGRNGQGQLARVPHPRRYRSRGPGQGLPVIRPGTAEVPAHACNWNDTYQNWNSLAV
jgi:hypothetical protein